MSRHPPQAALLLGLCLALAAGGCSLRYDTDDLRGGDDPAVDVDGARSDAQRDAAPPVDAAAPDAQLPSDCGGIGQICCAADPVCGFGDEFIECSEEDGRCAACGHLDEPCCRTGPECEGGLGCLGLIGLIETCITLTSEP